MYEVLLEHAAERDLKRLQSVDLRRVVPCVKALAVNPRPRGCRKIHGSTGDWRVRIGSYRILYEIDDKAKVVRVMRIKHRREAYG